MNKENIVYTVSGVVLGSVYTVQYGDRKKPFDTASKALVVGSLWPVFVLLAFCNQLPPK